MSTTVARRGLGPSWAGELARAAAGPVACAVVLIGLLAAWVVTGGAGTIHRVRMQVSQAEVPPRGFTAASAAAVHSVGMYLTIRNPTGQADELIGVTSPLARRVVLTRGQTVVSELTVPAHGTLTVAPSGGASGASAILEDPRAYETRPTVPLVLTFRHTGTLTVNAAVNAPGS